MSPVEYVWVIPLLPLVALVINFCVTRPLDVAAQRKAGLRPTGGSGGHNLAGTAAGHEQAENHGPGAAHDDADTGGHGHGGITTTWGLAGAVVAVIAMVGSFALAIAIFFQFLSDPLLQTNGYTVHLWNWFTFGSLNYAIDFRVDPLTAVMLVV
ncbi:MAG TPA: hypothetical protein VFN78_12765, partial [Ktedonobacterales bacterium]|nr:hypothetical protein [Ktedonobacterales bacterium]